MAQAIAPRRALHTQALQPPHAAFVARAPRFDAAAYPHLFFGEHLVEFFLAHRFDGEHVLFAFAIRRVVSRKITQDAAIQFDNTGSHAIEKASIVSDEQQIQIRVAQKFFQPVDRRDVQVIGRLVQHQQIRLAHQGTRQGYALAPTAGQAADFCIGVEFELL